MAVATRIVGALVAIGVAAGCQNTQPSALPQGLSVPDDARGVSISHRSGAYDVSFVIDRLYPAEGFIATVGADVARAGFEPLKDDWLNPGLASSHSKGWKAFTSSLSGTPSQIHQWAAQWRDVSGNVIAYTLQYSSPRGTGAMLDRPLTAVLQVDAAWVPAGEVAALQRLR